MSKRKLQNASSWREATYRGIGVGSGDARDMSPSAFRTRAGGTQ